MKTNEEIRAELGKAIEKIRNDIFLLDMKDNWTTQDYIDSRAMHRKLRDMENHLATIPE